MRVTNSMLVSHFMNNLNSNLTRLDKLQGQLASNKKFAHLSDDPISVIFSQQARLRLNRLAHYQQNVETATNWTTQTETTTRQINDMLVSAYETCIDASTNVKGAYDLKNVSQYLEQVRDQLLSNLNATFGEKYLYGGYNTTGYIDGDHRVIPPFTVEYTSREEQRTDYKGDPMFDIGEMMFTEEGEPMLDAAGNIMYDGSGDPVMWTVTEAKIYYNGFELTQFLNSYNPTAAANGSDPWTNVPGYDPLGATEALKWAGADLKVLFADYYDEDAAALGNDPWTNVPGYDPLGATETLKWAGVDPLDTNLIQNAAVFNELLSNGISVDVGTGIPMEIQINGLDLIFYDKNDYSKNIFSLLHNLYDTVDRGAEVDEITAFIPELQAASNHTLAKVATLGGKTNRLEMLTSRYDQDFINYTQMKSDAEDADQAEVIMNYKMAEAVYKAALSTGAYIIQPTLMDFLR